MTATMPDEVVTNALVRYLDVPGVAGEIALITLDNGLDHTQPSSSARPAWRRIDAALDAIEAHTPTVAAIAVTGKPFIFAVGADISGMAFVRERAQALRSPGSATRCSARFKNASVPTFAFVNGAVDGRRPGTGPALPVPHAGQEGRRDRVPRGLPRPGPGLGRHADPAATWPAPRPRSR